MIIVLCPIIDGLCDVKSHKRGIVSHLLFSIRLILATIQDHSRTIETKAKGTTPMFAYHAAQGFIKAGRYNDAARMIRIALRKARRDANAPQVSHCMICLKALYQLGATR